MKNNPQIFQTNSRWRWRTFQWTGRFGLFVLLLTVPIIYFTLSRGIIPGLPLLSTGADTAKHLSNPQLPKGMNSKEIEKYRGFNAYIKAREANEKLRHMAAHPDTRQVRAGFLVDWDPQSFYSLQKNIDKLNMVVPEWFFIDPATDTLQPQVDMPALELLHQKHVPVVALINNINEGYHNGDFDSRILHRILNSKEKKEKLIGDILKYLKKYDLQGINIDFEEFKEKGDEPLISFQKELYERLHPLGYLVTQDIMSNNADFNIKALSDYNDYLFLMAYDEHWSTSVPGPVSSQSWIEKVLDETAKEVPSGKIVLCIAGYGYDWPESSEAVTVTYQQALANAKRYKAEIHFDDNTYNNNYSYRDAGGLKHDVYFADAATNFNTLRFADEYGAAGTALWRLGSEDERLWNFYGRSLTNKSLQTDPFDFNSLRTVNTSVEKPDYIGDGEVLSVITEPEVGKISLETDTTEGIIAEQQYLQLPTKYVIQKYGNVHNQVLLTFDDGPDPEYTPQILDILKKEKVPAAFFVVGMEAENNLPLLKRIYDEGHEIGNHTFTHPNIALVSMERAKTEMEATRLLIEAVTGRSTVLFRAPYNADAEPSSEVEMKPIAISKQKNYYTVGESIDPNDWEAGVTADSIYQRTIRQYEANPEKGIILLHDAGGDREATVKALPRIIHYFKYHGVAFTTVAGLLHSSKDIVMPGVSSRLVKIDGKIAGIGYWIGNLLNAAFWIAIFLGLTRIALMAVMAILQEIRNRRSSRKLETVPAPAPPFPSVSIIVPAYNEEVNAVKTVSNLLMQDYPRFDIIFVDDGSNDQTFERVFQRYGYHERVRVLTKPNGGKASALNFGISQTNNEFVLCIDADTQLKPDALSRLMEKFMCQDPSKGSIGAVAGNVKVGNEHNLLTKWQSIEYTTAQNFDRRAFELINGITVVPGAIGAFRRKAIEDAGGFTTDTLAEDCDLTIRILRSGYRVVNCIEAIAVTEAPESLQEFMKQRFRWTYGIMQSFWKNRETFFNPRYKGLGMVSMPNILLFQIILPMIAPLADLMLIFSLFWNRHNPASMGHIGFYYAVFMFVDMFVSLLAFFFEKERVSKLVWLIPQRFVYRQLMYVILFKALRKALKGESQGWGVLKRTGNVRQMEPRRA